MRTPQGADKLAIIAHQKVKEAEYWKKQLAGEPQKAAFPYTNDAKGTAVAAGNETGGVKGRLATALVDRLWEMSNHSDYTLHVILTSGVAALLYKYTGHQDIMMATPIYKQAEEGEYVNTILPLRVRVHDESSLKHLLMQVRQVMTGAVEHQSYPVELLISRLMGQGQRREQEQERGIVETAVLLRNIQEEKDITCIDPSILFSYSRINRYLEVEIRTRAGLIFQPGIRQMFQHLERLLTVAARNVETRLSALEILSVEEKKQVMETFNQTTVDYPIMKTIPGEITEQAERIPDTTAVVGGWLETRAGLYPGVVQLTYRQLNEQAQGVARLLKNKGIQADVIVGLVVKRSVPMIIGILGILKAGGAYLPIDPEYPRDRIDYMLRDSGARILLKKSEIRNPKSRCFQTNPNAQNPNDQNKRTGVTVLDFEHLNFEFVSNFEFRASNFFSSNLAYVIYTSGTTGKPKGAMIRHHSLFNRLNWMRREYSLDKSDVIIQKTPFTFDVSVWELLWWGMVGAKLYLLAPGGEKDPRLIIETVEKYHITIMHFVPSMLNAFLDYVKMTGTVKRLKSLRQVIASGEALTLSQVELFNELLYKNNGSKLANLYGPTEATIDVSRFDCSTGETFTVIPIGKPIDNTRFYVLDRDMHLLPIEIAGELCIGGDGLAIGYLNRPGLTAEKFVFLSSWSNRSCRSNIKLYKTGDLARWLLDGNVEFLGRIDHQVKIRGYRIELGEIEHRLSKHEKIKEAVVIAADSETNDKYLCAYLVPHVTHQEIPIPALREYLSKTLPDYMVPAHFIFMEQIPLTANGKVNRKALPGTETLTGSRYVAPRDEVEIRLVDIWSRELGVEKEKIGIDTSFFELGGQSLRATRVIAQIHKELEVNVAMAEMFDIPYIRKLAERIKTRAREKYTSIKPAEEREYYALSSAQKRLYILQQMDITSTGYNISNVLVLQDKVEINTLEQVFKRLAVRHESLRTSFVMVNGEPVQCNRKTTEIPIISYDIKDGPGGQNWQNEVDRIIKEFIRPFNLGSPPLIRVGLVNARNREQILLYDIHHIITDGVSQDILTGEFLSLYAGRELSPLRLQYKDYSRWMKNQEVRAAMQRQEKYWIDEFAGSIPLIDISTDFPRPPVMTFEGNLTPFQLEPGETSPLKKVARREGVTLFMLLLAVYNVTLFKLSGQEDLVVGIPIAGRRHADLENIIGMFVNTLAVRTQPRHDKGFEDFLSEIKEKTLNAFNNQDYQFEDLVEKVVKDRNTGRNPLFDAVFLFQNIEKAGSEKEMNLKVKPYGYKYQTAKFDLKLEGAEGADKLFFTFEYRTRLFKEQTIQRFIGYLKKAAAAVSQNPAVKIRDIEIIPAQEKEQLLYRFNDTIAGYPREQLLHRLFENQVESVPDRVALEGQTPAEADEVKTVPTTVRQTMTYRVLNEKANRLAWRLRGRGITAGEIVGLMARRSIETVTAVIAIIKAGAAFLPLDPEYPDVRKQFMVKDSRIRVLITTADQVVENKPLQRLLTKENIIPVETGSEGGETFPGLGSSTVDRPGDPAYVIYTSGSTGQPKGVAVTHRNAVNYICWAIRQYVKEEAVRFPLFTSLSFDLTITSIFTPLLSGNTLVVYGGTNRESLIEDILKDNQVEVVKLTPSHLKFIGRGYEKPGPPGGQILHSRIKRFIVGGEALETQLALGIVEKFADPPAIYNEYGPTEATVGCMIYRYDPGKDNRPTVPVGIPVANVQVYLLDRIRQPVPTGVAGELVISGDGVATGYLNQVELTREKFVENPFLPGKRMYRTGDLARFLEEGNIDFLGRIDHQVKIRGFRIEMEEIEAKLKEYRKPTPMNLAEMKTQIAELHRQTHCATCLLPTDYPGIQPDEQGVCNTCREYEKYKEKVDGYFKTGEDFAGLMEQSKKANRGEYDCLLLFSGGKDSTFVLYRLIDMGLKVLTYTFDNGYISEGAFANIREITSSLGVDHITGRAKNMNKVFVESLHTNQDVCHGCWNTLNTLAAQLAHEKGIHLIVSGLSRGQIFEMRLEALFQQEIFDEDQIEAHLLLFRKAFHSKNNKYTRMLEVDLPEEVVEQLQFVDYFRYYGVPTAEIRNYLTGKGWVQPEDTGFCSSNCTINDVGICVHLKERGHHFYAGQLSWDYRLGVIPREQGLKELEFQGDVGRVEQILRDIGYYTPPIEDAVVIQTENPNGDKILNAYIVSGEEYTVSELRGFLSQHLPDYMIPSGFIRVDRIPLTPAGKVDQEFLLKSGDTRLQLGTTYVAPTTHLEKIIAQTWKETLKLDDVGIQDNFFDLGGTSFDIIRICGRLGVELKREIPVVKMFAYTTVRTLADYLSQGKAEAREEQKAVEFEKKMLDKAKKGRSRIKQRARQAEVSSDI